MGLAGALITLDTLIDRGTASPALEDCEGRAVRAPSPQRPSLRQKDLLTTCEKGALTRTAMPGEVFGKMSWGEEDCRVEDPDGAQLPLGP